MANDTTLPVIDDYMDGKYDQDEAVKRLMPQKLTDQYYQMLVDPQTEVYAFSPLILFDMWESEMITGDPRNSRYIRED